MSAISDEGITPRSGSPLAARVITGLAVALPLGTIAWILDWFRVAGLVFSNEQFLAGILAVALVSQKAGTCGLLGNHSGGPGRTGDCD